MTNMQRINPSKPNASKAAEAKAGKAFLALVEEDRDLACAWTDLVR